MCAVTLSPESSESLSVSNAPGSSLANTVVFSADPPGKSICPVCEAPNDSDWIFCQQCGSKLGSTSSSAAPIEGETLPSEKPALSTTIQAPKPASKAKPAGISCPKCSEALVGDAAFCHKCGAVTSNARTVAMSSFKPAPKARLLLIVDGEATGDEFELKGDTVVGRVDGDITFPHDDYMSGRHASLIRRDGKFVLVDEGSRNGSFVRIKKEAELKPGDFILLGKQLFKFEM
jgi:hypothetical protein